MNVSILECLREEDRLEFVKQSLRNDSIILFSFMGIITSLLIFAMIYAIIGDPQQKSQCWSIISHITVGVAGFLTGSKMPK
jgi:hypothetical protein